MCVMFKKENPNTHTYNYNNVISGICTLNINTPITQQVNLLLSDDGVSEWPALRPEAAVRVRSTTESSSLSVHLVPIRGP